MASSSSADDRSSLLRPEKSGLPAFSMTQKSYGPSFEFDQLQSENTLFNPVLILSKMIRWWWVFSACMVLGALAGLAATWAQPPMYKATAKLEVAAPSAKVFKDIELLANGAESHAQKTAMERLKSRSLFERVAFELNLGDDQDFIDPKPAFSLTNLASRILGGDRREIVADLSAEQRMQRAIGTIAQGISLSAVRGTNILSVSFSSRSPVLSAEIANQIVSSYLDQRLDKNTEASAAVRTFMTRQVAQVKKRLQASEERLLAYAKAEGITVNGDEASLISANMQSINTALAKSIQDRLELGRQVEQIGKGRTGILPASLESEGLGKLKLRLVELRTEYKEKLATYKPGFPVMRNLSAQIAELAKQEKRAIGSIAGSIKLKHRAAVSSVADLRKNSLNLKSNSALSRTKRFNTQS